MSIFFRGPIQTSIRVPQGAKYQTVAQIHIEQAADIYLVWNGRQTSLKELLGGKNFITYYQFVNPETGVIEQNRIRDLVSKFRPGNSMSNRTSNTATLADINRILRRNIQSEFAKSNQKSLPAVIAKMVSQHLPEDLTVEMRALSHSTVKQLANFPVDPRLTQGQDIHDIKLSSLKNYIAIDEKGNVFGNTLTGMFRGTDTDGDAMQVIIVTIKRASKVVAQEALTRKFPLTTVVDSTKVVDLKNAATGRDLRDDILGYFRAPDKEDLHQLWGIRPSQQERFITAREASIAVDNIGKTTYSAKNTHILIARTIVNHFEEVLKAIMPELGPNKIAEISQKIKSSPHLQAFLTSQIMAETQKDRTFIQYLEASIKAQAKGQGVIEVDPYIAQLYKMSVQQDEISHSLTVGAKNLEKLDPGLWDAVISMLKGDNNSLHSSLARIYSGSDPSTLLQVSDMDPLEQRPGKRIRVPEISRPEDNPFGLLRTQNTFVKNGEVHETLLTRMRKISFYDTAGLRRNLLELHALFGEESLNSVVQLTAYDPVTRTKRTLVGNELNAGRSTEFMLMPGLEYSVDRNDKLSAKIKAAAALFEEELEIAMREAISEGLYLPQDRLVGELKGKYSLRQIATNYMGVAEDIARINNQSTQSIMYLADHILRGANPDSKIRMLTTFVARADDYYHPETVRRTFGVIETAATRTARAIEVMDAEYGPGRMRPTDAAYLRAFYTARLPIEQPTSSQMRAYIDAAQEAGFDITGNAYQVDSTNGRLLRLLRAHPGTHSSLLHQDPDAIIDPKRAGKVSRGFYGKKYANMAVGVFELDTSGDLEWILKNLRPGQQLELEGASQNMAFITPEGRREVLKSLYKDVDDYNLDPRLSVTKTDVHTTPYHFTDDAGIARTLWADSDYNFLTKVVSLGGGIKSSPIELNIDITDTEGRKLGMLIGRSEIKGADIAEYFRELEVSGLSREEAIAKSLRKVDFAGRAPNKEILVMPNRSILVSTDPGDINPGPESYYSFTASTAERAIAEMEANPLITTKASEQLSHVDSVQLAYNLLKEANVDADPVTLHKEFLNLISTPSPELQTFLEQDALLNESYPLESTRRLPIGAKPITSEHERKMLELLGLHEGAKEAIEHNRVTAPMASALRDILEKARLLI